MNQKHPLLCTRWVSKKENVPLEEYQVLSVSVLKALFPGQITIVTVIIRVIDGSFKHLLCTRHFYTAFYLSFLFKEYWNHVVKVLLPDYKISKDTELLVTNIVPDTLYFFSKWGINK